jgi:hypothetical protein
MKQHVPDERLLEECPRHSRFYESFILFWVLGFDGERTQLQNSHLLDGRQEEVGLVLDDGPSGQISYQIDRY